MFVECALFDPVRVALTGRRHQIVSDARQRFERGLDPALMPDAIEAATAHDPGTCAAANRARSPRPAPSPPGSATPRMRFARIAGLGGSDIPPDEAVASLERLGFAVRARDAEQGDGRGAVLAQRHRRAGRRSICRRRSIPRVAAKVAEGCAVIEPECDLIEEVLRLQGLDAVPPVSLPRDGAGAAARR